MLTSGAVASVVVAENRFVSTAWTFFSRSCEAPGSAHDLARAKKPVHPDEAHVSRPGRRRCAESGDTRPPDAYPRVIRSIHYIRLYDMKELILTVTGLASFGFVEYGMNPAEVSIARWRIVVPDAETQLKSRP